MGRKRFTPMPQKTSLDIYTPSRSRRARGGSVQDACRKVGISEQTHYRWKRQFGQMEVAEVQELRHLRQENARLKKVLSERDLEVEEMKELEAKKVVTPRGQAA